MSIGLARRVDEKHRRASACQDSIVGIERARGPCVQPDIPSSNVQVTGGDQLAVVHVAADAVAVDVVIGVERPDRNVATAVGIGIGLARR